MSKRLIDVNPLTGLATYFHYDELTDSTTVSFEQDTGPVIEDNKRLVLEADHQKQMKNDWIKYARVPDGVIYEWRIKYGVDFFNKDHWPRVMQLINSRDYRDVKTSAIHHDR